MAIGQRITQLPVPPTSTDPSSFRQRADNFVVALQTLPNEINNWSEEANATAEEINYNTNLVERYVTESKTYKAEAMDAANRAEKAASEIEGYILPTEATYTYQDIDNMQRSPIRLFKQVISEDMHIGDGFVGVSFGDLAVEANIVVDGEWRII